MVLVSPCARGSYNIYRFELISIPIYGLGQKYFKCIVNVDTKTVTSINDQLAAAQCQQPASNHLASRTLHVCVEQKKKTCLFCSHYLVADISSAFGIARSEIKTTVGKLDQILIDERVYRRAARKRSYITNSDSNRQTIQMWQI